MSYEEIDKSNYGTDVFTNGAEGRYARPKRTPETSVKASKKEKRAPKIPSSVPDDRSEYSIDNVQTDETEKVKKKSRKVRENGSTQNDDAVSQVASSIDGETVVKAKKKRAPKIETNSENIDPTPTIDVEPVKKKKNKAPKIPAIDDDLQTNDGSTISALDPSLEMTSKVRKPKKHKTPKTTADPTGETFDGSQMSNYGDYANSEYNGGYNAYGETPGDISYDAPPPYPSEAEQIFDEPEKSEYESAIMNAYSDLASKLNFNQFVGTDEWCIRNLPKSARMESKSRIRKMLPGGKDDRPEGRLMGGRLNNQRGGFLDRLRTGMSSLVRDESNLIFGDQSKYEFNYFEEEEDGVDTDDLHRYAQKLRELEDTDREINPEFLVIRDGKPVYAVHEADAEGKMILSKRKPLYDRYGDQKPEDEPGERKTLLARFKNPFARNKDKDAKGSNSPRLSTTGTPDSIGKRKGRKTSSKILEDDMVVPTNAEALLD